MFTAEPRRLLRLVGGLVAVAVLSLAPRLSWPVAAQTAVTPPGELGTLQVPGGRWALGELGLPATLERGSVVRLLVQRAYDPTAAIRPSEVLVARVQAGLDLAVRVEAAARAAASGGVLALSSIKTRQAREQLSEALEAIGAKLRERRKQYTASLDDSRRAREVHAALKAMGLDVPDVVARLNKGESVAVEVPADELPLAPSLATWRQVVFERDIPARALFAEILRTPNALLLWHGVLALDLPTRRFLEVSPDLVRTLYRESAPLFAAYSAQVAVRDGRVQIAGGSPVQPLWEALVDEPVASPARFVRRLFTRDDGRLAVFFDLMQRLPSPQRTFAAGLWLQDRGERLDRFRALYSAVSSVDGEWKPSLAPLKRSPADPWLLLRGLAAAPASGGNGLAGPQQRRFWERAFDDGLPDQPDRAVSFDGHADLVDAAWLVEHVCQQATAVRAERMRQVMIVPRAFPTPQAAELPGALMAARGLVEFPALFLALDRSDLLTPALAGALARQADAVDRIGDRDRRALALAAFQGAVAVVGRMVATAAVSRDVALASLASLAAVPLRDDSFGSGIGDWLVDRLLPKLGAAAGDMADSQVVTALATSAGSRRRVAWEGETYVVDWTKAERARLAKLRQAQAGFTVDHVVRLVQLRRRIAALTPTPEQARDAAQDLGALIKVLETAKPMSEISEPLQVSRLLGPVPRELERVKSARDRDRLERAADRLGRVIDWTTGHVLASLAYTPYLGDPDGATARAGDLSLRHRFGVHDPSESARRDDPWRVPTLAGANGGVTGALLGVDLALARLALRRLSTGTVPPPATLISSDIDVLLAQVALASPRAIAGSDMSAAAQALARGRAQVAAAAGDPTALDALAEAGGLSGDRRSVLAWMTGHEPTRVVSMFSLGEFVLIGGGDGHMPDAVGTPTMGLLGRWRLEWPAVEPFEPYSGRPTLGLMATFVPDASLRVAELIEHAQLPLELLPGVLAYATQDVIEDTSLLSTDDWLGLVRRAGALTKARFDDIVSALAGVGVLSPAEGTRQ